MARVVGLDADPDLARGAGGWPGWKGFGCGGPDLHLRLVPAPWIFIIAFAPHPAGVPDGAPHPSQNGGERLAGPGCEIPGSRCRTVHARPGR